MEGPCPPGLNLAARGTPAPVRQDRHPPRARAPRDWGLVHRRERPVCGTTSTPNHKAPLLAQAVPVRDIPAQRTPRASVMETSERGQNHNKLRILAPAWSVGSRW